MNLDHYTSLEIARKLQEAGIEFPDSGHVWIHFPSWRDGATYIPAPSLSELLDELSVLPTWESFWWSFPGKDVCEAKTATDAAALMLIKLRGELNDYIK